MGLDQYAHTITKRGQNLRKEMLTLSTDKERQDFHKATRLGDEVLEVCYWRKHANLNEWMTQLALRKGVVKDGIEFNCVDLVLEAEDIDELDKIVNGKGLPTGAGFFWGRSTDADTENDRHFITVARKALAEGQQVIYSCWW
jgi:hypothetical protein